MTFIDFKKLLLDAELTIPKFTELVKKICTSLLL